MQSRPQSLHISERLFVQVDLHQKNDSFHIAVAMEDITLVLEGRYRLSKQRVWNSNVPTPLLVNLCLWEKAVPSVGLTSLTQNLLVMGETLA